MDTSQISKLEQELLRVGNEYSKAAEDLAAAKSNYDNLNDLKKDVLSQQMTEQDMRTSGKNSEARLERLARATEEWKIHMEGVFIARTTFNQLSARLNGLEVRHKSIQSVLSVEKEKMKMI